MRHDEDEGSPWAPLLEEPQGGFTGAEAAALAAVVSAGAEAARGLASFGKRAASASTSLRRADSLRRVELATDASAALREKADDAPSAEGGSFASAIADFQKGDWRAGVTARMAEQGAARLFPCHLASPRALRATQGAQGAQGPTTSGAAPAPRVGAAVAAAAAAPPPRPVQPEATRSKAEPARPWGVAVPSAKIVTAKTVEAKSVSAATVASNRTASATTPGATTAVASKTVVRSNQREERPAPQERAKRLSARPATKPEGAENEVRGSAEQGAAAAAGLRNGGAEVGKSSAAKRLSALRDRLEQSLRSAEEDVLSELQIGDKRS